jgi:hypothetical protein
LTFLNTGFDDDDNDDNEDDDHDEDDEDEDDDDDVEVEGMARKVVKNLVNPVQRRHAKM